MSRLTSLLGQLISFRTISSDHEANANALDWVAEQLVGLPLYLSRHEFEGFPSLVIGTCPGKKSTLCLHSHIDVVGVGNNEKLFSSRIECERLSGRGAYDMKFATACYIRLLQDLGECITQHNFHVMITTDEEMGGFKGTQPLLAGGYSYEVCFSPDGGQDWQFERVAKGVLQVRLVSTGLSAHGSRPWQGRNAIKDLLNFISEIDSHFPSEPCGDETHYHTSANLGIISGGEAVNQVPASAEAYLDFRFVPEQPREELWRILREVGRSYPSITIKEHAYGSSYTADPSNPYFQTYSRLMTEVTGVEESFVHSHGSSDARFFAERNIPVIAIRPPGGGLHGDDEWIDVKALGQFYQILKSFVAQSA